MLNAVPKSLAFAHILRVNPELESSPPLTWDQRKGVLRVTHSATTSTGISWDKAEELDSNAYIWGWDLNTAGPLFQRENKTLFPTPDTDFWQCLYAQHVFGPQVFDFLWKRRNPSSASQFESLVYAVTGWGKAIGGWSFTRLKTAVTVGLPYVFAVARINGTLTSKGFGIRPVMSTSRTQQTLI